MRNTVDVFDNAPVLVAGVDAHGRVTVFNRACEEMTGYPRADVLGQPLVDILVPPGWRDRVRHRFAGESPEALAEPHRSPWLTKLGDERLIEWRCFPHTVANVASVLGMGIDVTEQSRGERRLAVQQLVTRVLAESRSVEEAAVSILTELLETLEFDAGGLWAVDDEARLHCRNFVARPEVDGSAFERTCRSMILSEGQGLPGQVWATGKLVWISDVSNDEHFLRGAAARAAGFVTALAFPVAGVDFTGVVEFFSRTTRERDGELIDVLESVARQITGFVTRIRAEEQARHAQRLAEHASRVKDDLLGRISHELRNPLTAIQGWLDVLARRSMDDAARGRAIHVARRNTALLRLLADDLVDAARIGRGGALAMSRERVDVAEVVRDVVSESAAAAPGGIQLALDIAPGEAGVFGDPLRLRQVFGNLLSNALKFTARTVTVRVSSDGPTVLAQVVDDGIGMSREQFARVFDSYWQAGMRPGGLGLGLTIARHIVDLHGGQLEVTSDGPGRGATFAVRLPRAKSAPIA